jgi:hypothetical protein
MAARRLSISFAPEIGGPLRYVVGQSNPTGFKARGPFRKGPGAAGITPKTLEQGGRFLGAEARFPPLLGEGLPESIETTALHLDVLRDLRRLHSHICSVAYPVLDAAGELPVRQNLESDQVALPAPATQSLPR